MIRESVTLYYRHGSSDKVYQAEIADADGGYVVSFAFGRRGTTLQTGKKTPAPVPFDQAKKVFDRLVAAKKAKGYSPGPDGTPYVGTEKADRDSGLRPQLLNPITEDDAARYLADPAFWMQEKIDGRRVLIRKQGREVCGINRNGLTVALPEPVMDAAQALKGDFVLDGEAVGNKLMAFDCLSKGAKPLEPLAYRDRWRNLLELVGGRSGVIQVLPTAAATGDKRDLFRFLQQKGAEGVVFKDRNAPYTPGRPASGGPQLKVKFCATASCIVAEGRADRRSVALELLDGFKLVQVGNVSIPANRPIPMPGEIAEVRYLYAYRGGALFQPVYLGRRTDILTAACTTTQLKFKKEDDDEAE